MKLRLLTLLGVVSAISGCHTVNIDYQTQPTPKQPEMEFVRVHQPTVDKSSVDFTKFTSFNLPQGKGSMTAYNAPKGMNTVMDIKPFFGDLEDLVYMITVQTGYKYLPFSGLKVTPVITTYHANNKTAFEALVEINNKIGTNATIKISEVAKTVQIIYPISTSKFE